MRAHLMSKRPENMEREKTANANWILGIALVVAFVTATVVTMYPIGGVLQSMSGGGAGGGGDGGGGAVTTTDIGPLHTPIRLADVLPLLFGFVGQLQACFFNLASAKKVDMNTTVDVTGVPRDARRVKHHVRLAYTEGDLEIEIGVGFAYAAMRFFPANSDGTRSGGMTWERRLDAPIISHPTAGIHTGRFTPEGDVDTVSLYEPRYGSTFTSTFRFVGAVETQGVCVLTGWDVDDAAKLRLGLEQDLKPDTPDTRILEQGKSLEFTLGETKDDSGVMCTWLSAYCERASSFPRIAGTFTFYVEGGGMRSSSRTILVTPNIVLIDATKRNWKPTSAYPYNTEFRICTTAAHRTRGLSQPAENSNDQMHLFIKLDGKKYHAGVTRSYGVSVTWEKDTVVVAYTPPTGPLKEKPHTFSYELILQDGETIVATEACVLTTPS